MYQFDLFVNKRLLVVESPDDRASVVAEFIAERLRFSGKDPVRTKCWILPIQIGIQIVWMNEILADTFGHTLSSAY